MKKSDWYQFYKVNQCLLTSYLEAKGGRLVFPKVSGLPALNDYYYLDGHTYFGKNVLQKIWRVLEKKPYFWADYLINIGEKEGDKFLAFAKKISTKVKIKSSLREYFNKYLEFCQYFQYLLGLAGLPLIFEPVLENDLQNKIDKLGKETQAKESKILGLFSMYHDLTFAKQEEKAMLILARKYYRKKKIGYYNFHLEIKKHLDKWSWLKSHLLLNPEPMSKAILVNRIEKAWAKNPHILLKSFQKSIFDDKREFNNIIKEHPALKGIAGAMQKVIGYRDYRYGRASESCLLASRFLKEFAKKLNIQYQDLIHLTPLEVKKLIEKFDRRLVQESRARQKIYGYLFEDDREFIFSGEKAKRELNKLIRLARGKKEIKGLVAQNGFVSGRVRVIHNYQELKKMRKGEILVTEQTTPSYIVALQKAKAIITDLGGITCHAAIVARELKIPCIVGTKIATQVLKDGDRVEVDANNGLIKKLLK